MPDLKGYRQYAETDVINLFKLDIDPPVNKGTFVKLKSGFLGNQFPTFAGSPGFSISNTVNQRWSVMPSVIPVTASGDATIGMTLYDYKEEDENGEKLLYHPRKAVEMECVISGQAVPIVTAGFFVYSGVSGVVGAGSGIYLNNNAALQTVGAGTTATKVGYALGPKDANGLVLIKIDL